MKSVNYGNTRDTKGNKKSLIVGDDIYEKVIAKCSGHYGFGGENKDSFYVDVCDWNSCLEIINEGMKYGSYPFVQKETPFNIKYDS